MRFLRRIFGGQEDIKERRAALKKMAERKDLAASSRVREISLALRDTQWEIRVYAAELLGSLNCPDSIEPLVAVLADKTVNVLSVAVDALARLGNLCYPKGVEPLVAALADQSLNVRCPAALLLGELGDIRSFHLLVGICAGTEDEIVAAWHGSRAARILTSLLEHHVEKLSEDDLFLASRLESYDAIHDDTGGASIDGKSVSQMASHELQRRRHH